MSEVQVETRDLEQEARVAVLLTAPAPDLHGACIKQVQRLDRWDADPEAISEEQGDAEMDRWGALCRRVVNEPAATLRDLAGKAVLVQADLDRFYPLENYSDSSWQMMRALVRDAIAFGDADLPFPVAPDPSPALVALIAEWQAVEAYVNGQNGLSDAEAEPHHDRSLKLQMEIYRFPAASVADLLAKVPVFKDELQDALGGLDEARPPENTLAGAAWIGLFRDFGRLTKRTSRAVVPDPIFAAIEKDRALAAEHIRLLSISGSKPDDDPSWEPTHDASDAQWEHWRKVLLKTVPTTGAGCAALARYANEWVDREGIGLDEDGAKIFDLIGRSPLLTAPCPPASPDPIHAAIEAMHAADAAYGAWHAEYEKVGLDAAGGFEAETPLTNEQTRAEKAALATVPTTTAGRAALVTFTDLCIARRGHTDGTAQEGEDTVFHWAYRALASAIRGENPQLEAEDAEALALADAIEKLWPEWAALAERDYHDRSDEAEKRCDAMFERRMALIEAAEALPASSSRAVRYAKALAFAWYEHVGLWVHRKPLSDYGLDGRLVLNIEASLTGKPVWTGASA